MKLKILGEKDDETFVQLTGHFPEIVYAKTKTTYQKPGANPSEMEPVEQEGKLGYLIKEYGLSGPGQTEPDFEINLAVDLEEGKPENLVAKIDVDVPEESAFDDLTEIKGIGEKKKEKIMDVLLGE